MFSWLAVALPCTTYRSILEVSQVDLHLHGPVPDLDEVDERADLDGVEEEPVLHLVARVGQTLGQKQRRVVPPPRHRRLGRNSMAHLKLS